MLVHQGPSDLKHIMENNHLVIAISFHEWGVICGSVLFVRVSNERQWDILQYAADEPSIICPACIIQPQLENCIVGELAVKKFQRDQTISLFIPNILQYIGEKWPNAMGAEKWLLVGTVEKFIATIVEEARSDQTADCFANAKVQVSLIVTVESDESSFGEAVATAVTSYQEVYCNAEIRNQEFLWTQSLPNCNRGLPSSDHIIYTHVWVDWKSTKFTTFVVKDVSTRKYMNGHRTNVGLESVHAAMYSFLCKFLSSRDAAKV